jgi:phosphotransferase system HPr (HPr) family protein
MKPERAIAWRLARPSARTLLKVRYRGGIARLTPSELTLAHGVFGTGGRVGIPLAGVAGVAIAAPAARDTCRGVGIWLRLAGGRTIHLADVGPLAAARLARALRAIAPHISITARTDAPPEHAIREETRDTMAETTVTVTHAAGLHARPLAAFTRLARGFAAEITVENLTAGKGPVSARSPVQLLLLGVRQGQTIRIRATGPQADDAVTALETLVRNGFAGGEGADHSSA